MGARFHSWWQQIKPHPVATALIALLAIVIVLIILIILGYIFNWGWTGLGPYISPSHPKDSDFQRSKTLWDWLQLLIIPVVLAVAGYVINLTISKSEHEATEQRAQSEREAAAKRAETEQKIAEDNQRETALQAYIDKMSELLLEKHLRESQPEDEVRTLARVRTLTTLHRLGGKRKGSVIQFLHESKLIDQDNSVISLEGANLREINLLSFDLTGANLYKADLFRADLTGCILTKANLIEADLREAKLS